MMYFLSFKTWNNKDNKTIALISIYPPASLHKILILSLEIMTSLYYTYFMLYLLNAVFTFQIATVNLWLPVRHIE